MKNYFIAFSKRSKFSTFNLYAVCLMFSHTKEATGRPFASLSLLVDISLSPGIRTLLFLSEGGDALTKSA